MEIILIPLQLFAFRPPAVFAVVVVFIIASFFKWYSLRAKVFLRGTAVIWLSYGGWETYMTSWRSPSGDMAIRVDLVLFGPFLLGVLLLGFAILIFACKRDPGKA